MLLEQCFGGSFRPLRDHGSSANHGREDTCRQANSSSRSAVAWGASIIAIWSEAMVRRFQPSPPGSEPGIKIRRINQMITPRRVDPRAIPVFVRLAPEHGANHGRRVGEGLPVTRDKSIQIDQMRDTTWDAIRNPGDHHARIAVPDENDLL